MYRHSSSFRNSLSNLVLQACISFLSVYETGVIQVIAYDVIFGNTHKIVQFIHRDREIVSSPEKITVQEPDFDPPAQNNAVLCFPNRL